jgi:alkaline phosphatase D
MFFSNERRLVLKSFLLGILGLSPVMKAQAEPAASFQWTESPFTLGVASGSPSSDSVVIWTKLHFISGQSIPDTPVTIKWQMSKDIRFNQIVQEGFFTALPEEGHSVHVEVTKLESATQYYYRFLCSSHISSTGVTRTLPNPYSLEQRFNFALASCQNYEKGFFSAYKQLIALNPQLVLFVGDYIYENKPKEGEIRKHTGYRDCKTLVEYRQRYAQYRSDPLLQEAHRIAPWVCVWDDHEVSNDYAGYRDVDESVDFAKRRAAAYQAYWEYMPLPYRLKPKGASMQLYSVLDWGRLARFYLLDTRQYRTAPVCVDEKRKGSSFVSKNGCPEMFDEERSMLGAKQEIWLEDMLQNSRARWNFITQTTNVASLGAVFDSYWTDGWEGYPKARERLLKTLAEKKPKNPIVLGGDIHMNLFSELKYPSKKFPEGEPIALEFCGTSVTSPGWGSKRVQTIKDANPHIQYADSRKRGFLFFDVTHERQQVTVYAVDDVQQANSAVYPAEIFEVSDGQFKMTKLKRLGTG